MALNDFVFLLEHYSSEQPTNIGIFTSFKKATYFIENMPVKHPCALFKIQLDAIMTAGDNCEDRQGVLMHWHYNQ
jgi:hypothetical protein